MAAKLSNYEDKYEPLPRIEHVSGCIQNKHIVQGGRTQDFSEKSREILRSVVEVFDSSLEEWKQEQAHGHFPRPGTYIAASTSFNNCIYSFGGYDGSHYFNTLHKLDPKCWMWTLLSQQDADGAPMPKCNCGMAILGNSMVIVNGYGLPTEPTAPGSFISNFKFSDGRGWTNELHIYNISEGSWSCPATTGEIPPPCTGITFTAIDERRAVMFGGRYGEPAQRMNDVYIFEISTMNWKRLSRSGPWPEKRSLHAACCLNYDQQFPQLLMTGGWDGQGRALQDAWILNIERGKWRMVDVTMKGRFGHSLTAINLGLGLAEVLEFGGSGVLWVGNDAIQPKLANTTLMQFKQVESSGQWKLVNIVDNIGRKKERVLEEGNGAEQWLLQVEKERGIDQKNGPVVEEGRDTEKDEVLEVAKERDRLKETLLQMEQEKKRQNKRILEVENELKVAKEEKKKLLVQLQNAQVRANKLQEGLEKVKREQPIRRGKHEKSTQTEELQIVQSKRKVIAEKVITVTHNKQDIEWEEYGLKLRIPNNSLPEDVNRSQLQMKVSRTNEYQLPTKEGILVSAIYSFHHSLKNRKLCQPVTVEIQHCAFSGYFAPLFLVQSNEVSPPFKFSSLEDKAIDCTGGYCSFKLDHFCSFAVYLKWFVASLIWNLKPCAVLYYTEILPASFEIQLYVIPGLDVILKEIDDDMREKNAFFKRGPRTDLEYNPNEISIQLILPHKPVNGWTFYRIDNGHEKQTEDIVRMQRVLIPFQVRVEWSGDEGNNTKKLVCDVRISGTEGGKLTIISPIECLDHKISTSTNAGTIEDGTVKPIPFQDFAAFPPPTLPTLMEVIGVDLKEDWKAVGLGLGLENITLKTIQAENGKFQDCMTEVFSEWKNQATSEYSWRKLAEVICSRTVNKPVLLHTMWDRLEFTKKQYS